MQPIVVTGAGGTVGGVGRLVAGRLLERRLPVRAVVLREDPRTSELRGLGAEVIVADLTRGDDIRRALTGCRRVYFGLGVSPTYLETTVLNAAVARELGGLEVFVNMSQMTVSQMSLSSMTSESEQQRQHFLSEKVLDWSGLPVVHVRPTVFLQTFALFTAMSVRRDDAIRLPFGAGRTSPVDAADVADVVAAILADPAPHVGRTYELTGPRSLTIGELAAEYSTALGRTIRYVDVPYEPWFEQLRALELPDHTLAHLATVAKLHAQGRYDRLTTDVAALAGHPPASAHEFVARTAAQFGGTHRKSA